MELILVIGSFILLAITATRWGHDSRRLRDAGPWLAEPRPRRPRHDRAALTTPARKAPERGLFAPQPRSAGRAAS